MGCPNATCFPYVWGFLSFSLLNNHKPSGADAAQRQRVAQFFLCTDLLSGHRPLPEFDTSWQRRHLPRMACLNVSCVRRRPALGSASLQDCTASASSTWAVAGGLTKWWLFAEVASASSGETRPGSRWTEMPQNHPAAGKPWLGMPPTSQSMRSSTTN